VIDGATRVIAIVGDPIAHVRSPRVYNTLLAASGRNAVLVPWHVTAGDFRPVMTGLQRTRNLDGILVTYPFKQDALSVADVVGRMAVRVGAANVLRRGTDDRWTAEMFDGIGLVRAVAGLGQGVVGRHVELIGAGGAGSAIAFALAEYGAASLSIVDLDGARAATLAAAVARYYPDCRTVAGDSSLGVGELLINATPVGLSRGDGLPVPLPALTARTTIIDLVPRSDTALLQLARAQGCPHADGAAVVEGQARAILDYLGLTDVARPEGTP
jgi:shikimate dehydrogenase